MGVTSSDEEQLSRLDAAIAAIETGGQEYQMEGLRLRRGDLAAFYKARRDLQSQIAQAAGANTAVAVFEGR